MLLRKISPYKSIVIVYILIILIGALLLSLPISSRTSSWTSFLDALFTSTSATAVTGLVVVDTATHWSLFGQVVILLLIQVGGIGIMTIVSLLHLFISRQMSLYETNVLMQSTGALTHKDVRKTIRRVVAITAISELLGTILLYIRFVQDYSTGQAIYMGIFHSISAYCNAGFDILGTVNNTFVSLTAYNDDWLVSITVMLLISTGGIGFIVWNDIIEHKHHITKYKLHSKIVLLTNTILVFGSATFFLIFEYNNVGTIGNSAFGDKLLMSLFQSVTSRTAGFNTVDLAALTESSKMLTMILMMIGGGAGSTAGGIKITTFVVIITGIFAVAKRHKDITIFKKRVHDGLLRQAMTISAMWLILTFVATMIMCAVDDITLTEALFECFSALGTVGLTLGITTELGVVSRLILPILMFAGRVGIATFVLAMVEKKKSEGHIRQPLDNILIG